MRWSFEGEASNPPYTGTSMNSDTAVQKYCGGGAGMGTELQPLFLLHSAPSL